MIPDDTPFIRNLPPKTIRALQQAINTCSRRMGTTPDWVQRWIAFTVVADALTSSAMPGVSVFDLKGGAAIELRLRSPTSPHTPRASRDIDVTFRATFDGIDAAVRSSLAGNRQGFSFRAQDDGEVPGRFRRYAVIVSYQGASFSRVKLEVSAYEGMIRAPDAVPAPRLNGFGFESPETLPCLPLTKQIAQKLHAVTEVLPDGRTNDRFRDLVDLAMLNTLLPPSAELREVCEETFAIRDTHRWPPPIVAHAHWTEPLERMAREVGLPLPDAQAIVAQVQAYVDAIVAV